MSAIWTDIVPPRAANHGTPDRSRARLDTSHGPADSPAYASRPIGRRVRGHEGRVVEADGCRSTQIVSFTKGGIVDTTRRSEEVRFEVSSSRLVTALVAGFVATHIATVTGYWYHGINMPDLGWPNFNGVLLLGTDASPLAQFWAGTVYHTATGISYALFYAYIIHPWLPIKNSRGGNILKALIWAAILATISAIWWVPQLFNSVYQADLGWFSQNVGPLFFNSSEWTVPVGIYLWHAVWGLTLGLIYNPLPVES
jgi:hypothetical protein